MNNKAKFYVNGFGDNYFSDLYEELITAKKEVFINDWFLSPKIHLKRPIEENWQTRLDLVLHSLAKRGVKIYVIVYRENEDALYNNSKYAKNFLEKKH